MTHFVPELLSPAGNIEKLKVAVLYGANAIYLGGQKFGLRTASDNFTYEELQEGVEFAHKRDVKVFVVLNSFLHDKDLGELPEFLSFLEKIKVDAVICSDLGVIETVQSCVDIPIHLSTQASCLNSYSAKLWKELGVTRIVLGREVTIDEAKIIKKETGLEIEMFVHGSMCMAYSGNCTISNYTQGRDSNRGGCAHSCRFEYSLQKNEENIVSTFMSSKDLQGLDVLHEFISAGIDSLKVEGRMKTHHYVGTISRVYSSALNFFKRNGHFSSDDLDIWKKELLKVSHREYSLGSLLIPANSTSIYSEREHEERDYNVAGIVIEEHMNDFLLIEVRHAFYENDELELVPFKGESKAFKADFIKDIYDDDIRKTKPGIVVKIPYVKGAGPLNIIRSRVLPKASLTT